MGEDYFEKDYALGELDGFKYKYLSEVASKELVLAERNRANEYCSCLTVHVE